MFSTAFYAGFVFENPKWKFSDLNFDKDIALTEEKVGAALNASDPDLAPFRSHGGKMLHYHGWNDGSPSPLHSVDYYERAAAKMGGFQKTREFYRPYMAPGMMHCGAGEGPNLFGNALDFAPASDPEHNIFLALQHWVEEGVAPNRIVATKYHDNDPAKGVEMTGRSVPIRNRQSGRARVQVRRLRTGYAEIQGLNLGSRSAAVPSLLGGSFVYGPIATFCRNQLDPRSPFG